LICIGPLHCGQENDAAVIDGNNCTRLVMQFAPPVGTNESIESAILGEVNSTHPAVWLSGTVMTAASIAPNLRAPRRRALFQGGAIASRASYIVPCSGSAPFHHNKTLDRLSTRRRGSAEPSSDTLAVPARPQWGQRSVMAQVSKAVMVQDRYVVPR
jgi:hypothetical protein